jgi:hypothetical protein
MRAPGRSFPSGRAADASVRFERPPDAPWPRSAIGGVWLFGGALVVFIGNMLESYWQEVIIWCLLLGVDTLALSALTVLLRPSKLAWVLQLQAQTYERPASLASGADAPNDIPLGDIRSQHLTIEYE